MSILSKNQQQQNIFKADVDFPIQSIHSNKKKQDKYI